MSRRHLVEDIAITKPFLQNNVGGLQNRTGKKRALGSEIELYFLCFYSTDLPGIVLAFMRLSMKKTHFFQIYGYCQCEELVYIFFTLLL